MDKIQVTYLYIVFYTMLKAGAIQLELTFKEKGMTPRQLKKLVKRDAKRKGGTFHSFCGYKTYGWSKP